MRELFGKVDKIALLGKDDFVLRIINMTEGECKEANDKNLAVFIVEATDDDIEVMAATTDFIAAKTAESIIAKLSENRGATKLELAMAIGMGMIFEDGDNGEEKDNRCNKCNHDCNEDCDPAHNPNYNTDGDLATVFED